jgi:hypothetical protein
MYVRESCKIGAWAIALVKVMHYSSSKTGVQFCPALSLWVYAKNIFLI